ncbi:MAG: HEAT repeat domain-containing protein [Verrucomicrobiota bacterium]|nr:HEAT repeat domain-containing protein [Verrucomicrobiota bacterium]
MKRNLDFLSFALVLTFGMFILGGCSSKVERQTLERTNQLIEEKQFSDALSLLADGLEAEPTNLKLQRQVVIVYLNANDPGTAYRAYRKLLEKPRKKGQTGEPEYRDSDPVLIDALASKNPVVRNAAAKALSSAKDPNSLKPLVALLKDPDKDVRRAAANALGEIREKQAVNALIEVLGDESWFVRGEAAQSLGKIGDPKAAEALIKLLSDKDSYVRENASISLRLLGSNENKAVFQKALSSDDKLTRMTAAQALANLKDSQAEAILIEFTKDPDADYRRFAVDGLAEMKSGPGLPRIREMAKSDPAPEVRYIALLAIGLYGDKDSVSLLEEIIKNQNNDPEVRRAAFMAYRKIAEQYPELIKK